MPQQPETIRNRLLHLDTFATTLLVIACDTYGLKNILGAERWSPETIAMELEDDFGVELAPLLRDKLFTAINLVTSDDFWKRTSRFIQICNVLAGSELSNDFDRADAMECAWGLTEAMLIDPPDENDPEPLCTETRYYLGRVLDDEGIREPPDLLRLAIRDTPSGRTDYGDMDLEDPAMFAGEFQVQADKAAEIKQTVEGELRELFQELSSLPLKNGKTDNLLQRIKGKLAQ